jgi:cytochrome c553
MNSKAVPWFRDSLALIAIFAISGLVVIIFVVGFLVLPRFQPGAPPASTLEAIRQGLGFHSHRIHMSSAQPPLRIPTYVVWNESTIHLAMSGDAKRGEFIAINCTACHGEKGITDQTWIPNLAGLNRVVLYKQLNDFRSETRLTDPMCALAQSLTPQQWADVAAYFSLLPGAPASGSALESQEISYRTKDATQRIIFAGDPKRGIAVCATCHAPGAYRLGAPRLAGQNAPYIEQRLQNFAQAQRVNDMNMPMRTIAGMLSPEEMHAVALAFSNKFSKAR